MESIDIVINKNLEKIVSLKQEKNEARRMILDARLNFGREISQLRKDIPSTKQRGQEIAIRFPASKKMDVALRSDCRWLFEALHIKNGNDSDILDVLSIASIYEVGSDNPTVIRRKYRQAKMTKNA